jgi:hypothetical protein
MSPLSHKIPWLLQGPPLQSSAELDSWEDEGGSPPAVARIARSPAPIAKRTQGLIDRVQDVARRLTDDFVNGRTEMPFITFRSHSRALWRRVAILRRNNRTHILS